MNQKVQTIEILQLKQNENNQFTRNIPQQKWKIFMHCFWNISEWTDAIPDLSLNYLSAQIQTE